MMLSGFEAKNTEYYFKMKSEGVQFREFPADVLDVLKKMMKEVITEITNAEPKSKKIFGSNSKFQKNTSQSSNIAERNYPGVFV